MKISIIAAVAKNRVIGKNNDLPWSLPNDMKYFKQTTHGKPVIMGRKNWDSIPEKWRPLPNRKNIILTRDMEYGFLEKHKDVEICYTVNHALEIAGIHAQAVGVEEIFVIGGGEVYGKTIPLADRLYLTEIKAEIEGDVFFPEIDLSQWKEVSRVHNGIDEKHAHEFDFVVYEKI